jgi:hypothetical protein
MLFTSSGQSDFTTAIARSNALASNDGGEFHIVLKLIRELGRGY